MGNQTVFGSLLYEYLNETHRNNIKRINKLISLGADVNIGNPLRYITGIQYEYRPHRVDKIKYLMSIGVNFENKCIAACSFKDTFKDNVNNNCKHKMLYDTRLGKLVQTLQGKDI
jgi:hypothetical protein